ncbi:STAS domain-containing protein [Spongisporangium articulatum]|uniref:STAS domain-containing protein n=1 Tax=Spongisporangium articulatum TaxID=3362603 RepID=A0ABW8AM45_9ACTN
MDTRDGALPERGRDDIEVRLDRARPVHGMTALRDAVIDVVRSGSPVLRVDVAALGELSSTTVTALLWAQRRCRARGGVVVLSGVDRRNRRILEQSGLARVLPVEEPASALVRRRASA